MMLTRLAALLCAHGTKEAAKDVRSKLFKQVITRQRSYAGPDNIQIRWQAVSRGQFAAR